MASGALANTEPRRLWAIGRWYKGAAVASESKNEAAHPAIVDLLAVELGVKREATRSVAHAKRDTQKGLK